MPAAAFIPPAKPGGSSGQLQYNASGAFGGAAFSAVAGSGNLLTLMAQADTDVTLTLQGHSATQSGYLLQALKMDSGNVATLAYNESARTSTFTLYDPFNGVQNLVLQALHTGSSISVGVGASGFGTFGADSTGARLTIYCSGYGNDAGIFFGAGSNPDGQGYGPHISPANGNSPSGAYCNLGTPVYRWLGIYGSIGNLAANSPSVTPLAVQGAASQSAPILQLQGTSSTTAGRPQADIDTAWHVSTDATRSADLILRAWDYTGATEGFRTRSIAGVNYVSLYGGTVVAQPAAISAPSGGATVDTQARAAITAILNAIGAAAGGIGITA